MDEHFKEEYGDDYDSLKGEFAEAFQMALHKDVRQGIIKDNSRPTVES